MRTYYFDMDGVLANFHKAYATNKATALSETAMKNLEPFEENVSLANKLIEMGEKVYILTKAANEKAKMGKLAWLAKYMPKLEEENFICIVGHGRKIDFIKEDGMLIDDDKKNLKPWANEGHETYFVEVKGEPIRL